MQLSAKLRIILTRKRVNRKLQVCFFMVLYDERTFVCFDDFSALPHKECKVGTIKRVVWRWPVTACCFVKILEMMSPVKT